MTPETTTANTSKPPGPRCPKPRGIWIAIKSAASLTLRAVEFGFYHVLLSTVDRVSRLPRDTTVPEAMRLYRENIALKVQLDALEAVDSTDPSVGLVTYREGPSAFPSSNVRKAVGPPLRFCARAPCAMNFSHGVLQGTTVVLVTTFVSEERRRFLFLI